VENRPGASGNIGTQAVARAAPDGRTLLLQANTFVMNPGLFKQVPYDPVGSFTPIIRLTRGDLVLAVHPGVPATDAKAFADLARTRALDYASPGNGTPQHLGMELFRLVADIRLNHVPYRGSAPAIQDLIAGRVSAMVLPVHTALPLAAANHVRLLAVGSPQRSAAVPDVPTMAEAGFPGAEVDLWYGLLAPAGLPDAAREALRAALDEWLRLPSTKEQLNAQGMVTVGGGSEAFASVIAADRDRWASIVRRAGLSAD
jgi:tripartite-type tricarboxylate transporter receptor subunit TctC